MADAQDEWFAGYMQRHPGTDPGILDYLRGITDNPAAYENFLLSHPESTGSVGNFDAAIAASKTGQLQGGNLVSDLIARTNLYENVGRAVANPLSFSTGGLLGGESGVAQFDSAGSGVKSSSLTGGLSNQNVRAGLVALAIYAGGSALMSDGSVVAADGAAVAPAGSTTLESAVAAGATPTAEGSAIAAAGGATTAEVGAAGAAGGVAGSSAAGTGVGTAAGTAAGGINWGQLGGALLGAGASLYSGEQSAEAAQNAAAMQQAAADKATAENMRQFDIGQANMAPWLASGKTALEAQSALMGLGGDSESALAALQASPGYQFRLQQGQRGLEAGSAARGGMGSGKAMTGAIDYNQNFAANEYMNRLSQLDRMSGAGQASAAGMAQQGANYGARQGDIWTGSAGQQGAATIAANNARQSGLLGATNALSNYMSR